MDFTRSPTRAKQQSTMKNLVHPDIPNAVGTFIQESRNRLLSSLKRSVFGAHDHNVPVNQYCTNVQYSWLMSSLKSKLRRNYLSTHKLWSLANCDLEWQDDWKSSEGRLRDHSAPAWSDLPPNSNPVLELVSWVFEALPILNPVWFHALSR